MSSDELAKLHQLHKEGALTDAEYEEQKKKLLGGGKPKRAWYKSWWVRIPLFLIGIILLVNSLTGQRRPGPATLVSCDHADAKAAIKNAIEKNSTANAVTLRLLDLTEVKELRVSADNKERLCQGTAFLNAGKVPIAYRLWLSSDSQLLVEVNER